MFVCDSCQQRIKFGQSQLTAEEKSRLDLGGPNDRVNIIKAQCIKAIADYYNIEDWIAIWDPTLSRRENAVLFKHNAEPDMRRFK